VREAGQLALSMFRTSVRQWNKDGSSPVSDADIAVDRSISRRRLAIRGKRRRRLAAYRALRLDCRSD
jgi:fructose-1,6-bisphosphatase/inositol monophosphatase family enzyme